jgi:hypothetical protein
MGCINCCALKGSSVNFPSTTVSFSYFRTVVQNALQDKRIKSPLNTVH